MRRFLTVLLLAAAPALAQSPVIVTDHNLSATRPLPTQLSNGTAFIVPVLDTTLTARFPTGSTPADNESNAVTITRTGAFVFVHDGLTWDRWTGAVSQSGAWTVTANAGTGTFAVSGPLTDTQLRATAVPVSGTFWQATQPVSGTVAATQSGTWTVQPGNTPNTSPWLFSIHDGTNKAAVLNLAANDPLSVAVVDGTGSQITSFGGGTQYTEGDTDASITGTALMWEDTGDALRAASAAKPLPVNVVAGGAGDGSILDGVSSSIKATVLDYTNSNPLAVRLTDTGGDYVGAGAGTQYADGAAVATPTGTVALGHDGANVRAVTTDATGDLQVDVLTMPTTTVTGTVTANAGTGTMAVSGPLTDTQLRATPVPVSGTVTANAGTNLNTSALLTTTAHDNAFGTAGAADAQVRTVQGIAGGTAVPVSGTFWQTTQPVSGTFWQTTQPISIEQTGNNNAVDVLTIAAGDTNIGNVDVVTLPSVTIGTFPDNEPINVAQKGGAAVVAGPCEREVPLYAQISQTGGTQLVAGTASERIYVCSIAIVSATAQSVALVDGTGAVCVTSPTGLLGGSTAATGQPFAANGGWVLPLNPGGWAKTSTDADAVCLLQSGSGQVSGVMTYVSVPNI